jgi:hypothetical protein
MHFANRERIRFMTLSIYFYIVLHCASDYHRISGGRGVDHWDVQTGILKGSQSLNVAIHHSAGQRRDLFADSRLQLIVTYLNRVASPQTFWYRRFKLDNTQGYIQWSYGISLNLLVSLFSIYIFLQEGNKNIQVLDVSIVFYVIKGSPRK